MEHSVLPLPSINSYESSHHVLKWPDARIDSVGSNDKQQSDMNHPPPCAVQQQHSQRASDTIYGKRKTRRSHLSTDGLSQTTLLQRLCRTELNMHFPLQDQYVFSFFSLNVHIGFNLRPEMQMGDSVPLVRPC